MTSALKSRQRGQRKDRLARIEAPKRLSDPPRANIVVPHPRSNRWRKTLPLIRVIGIVRRREAVLVPRVRVRVRVGVRVRVRVL